MGQLREDVVYEGLSALQLALQHPGKVRLWRKSSLCNDRWLIDTEEAAGLVQQGRGKYVYAELKPPA